jgi:hypothetical protein
MPSPSDIATETVDELRALLGLDMSAQAERAAVSVVLRAVHRQLHRDIWQVYNHDMADPREALLDLVDPAVSTIAPCGAPVTSNRSTRHWREWAPGLDTDALTLGDVLDTMPGLPPQDIPELVRLFENPASPVALVGACTLAQHDALHALLGRGLLDQDEAFVIGFTAGTCRPRLTDAVRQAYRVALSSYGEPYRIVGRDLLAFDLGIKAGVTSGALDLDRLDVDALRPRRLGELRAALNIDPAQLRGFFALEQAVIPNTPASLRLPR